MIWRLLAPDHPKMNKATIMRSAVPKFWTDEAGVTSVEYGLIMALIGVLLIVAISSTGDALIALWERITDCLGAAC